MRLPQVILSVLFVSWTRLWAIEPISIGQYSALPDITSKQWFVSINDTNLSTKEQISRELSASYPDWQVVFTPLPVVAIDVEPDAEIGHYVSAPAQLRLIDNRRQTGNSYLTELSCSIHYRGGTAQFFDKKSFALKTLDAQGQECDTTLMGIRRDHTWILDAMAVDLSRLRNRFCFDLWNEVCSLRDSDMIANGTHGQYVEMIYNGRYHGLYCLSDKVNRKLLGLKKYQKDEEPHYRGLLYKCGSNTTSMGRWQLPDNYQLTDDYVWYDWSLEYPDEYPSKESWRTLEQLLLFTSSCDDTHPSPTHDELKDHFHINNFYEYPLFLLALNCVDNAMHNALVSYKNQSKNQKAWLTPWDLDGSLGRDGSSGDMMQWASPDIRPLGQSQPYGVLFNKADSLFMTELSIRWKEWSKGPFAVDNFNRRIDSIATLLNTSGAWQREVGRWDGVNEMPGVGVIHLAEDANVEIEKIKAWYRRNYASLSGLLLSFLPENTHRVEGEIIRAEDFGVSPDCSAATNGICLNKAIASGEHVTLTTPGTYNISGTIYLSSNTTLEFGKDVKIVRQAQYHDCSFYFITNQSALSRTYDHNITLRGLNLDVNQLGGPVDDKMIKGLQSVLGFFYVKNLKIEDLTITNLPNFEFGLQVCTFDSLTIKGANIEGDKDGIHLGRGRHFHISDCQFNTGDDPIAMNGHDYVISNPELGWIEDGLVENCIDLNGDRNIGYFSRMLAGSWCDWSEGMELQYGDAVVHNGKLYRLLNEGATIVTHNAPEHLSGEVSYPDNCIWYMQQDQEVGHTAGVRNVHFRNITLQKPRDIAFAIHFDKSSYSRSFYPGAELVTQTGLTFEKIYQQAPLSLLMEVGTPIDTIKIEDSLLGKSSLWMRNLETEGLTYDTTVVVVRNVALPAPDNFLNIDNHPAKLIVENTSEQPYQNHEGLKLVTIGDSQTQFCQWQPWLKEWLNLDWSAEETTTGTDGHQPMAVGGTWVYPYESRSISLRGRDAIYYQPDIIIIYAGQNDVLSYWKSADNPYTSPIDVVQWEPTYTESEVRTDVSSISAFKGLIEYLRYHLPETRIYLMTHVPVLCVVGMNPTGEFAEWYPSPRFATMEDVINFEMAERYPKDEYIRALGEYYHLPVIDQWKYSGINFYNVSNYYWDPEADCTQVHLNPEGDRLLAECIYKYLTKAPYGNEPDWNPTDSFPTFDFEFDKTTTIYNGFGQKLPTDILSRGYKGFYIIGQKKIIQL